MTSKRCWALLQCVCKTRLPLCVQNPQPAKSSWALQPSPPICIENFYFITLIPRAFTKEEVLSHWLDFVHFDVFFFAIIEKSKIEAIKCIKFEYFLHHVDDSLLCHFAYYCTKIYSKVRDICCDRGFNFPNCNNNCVEEGGLGDGGSRWPLHPLHTHSDTLSTTTVQRGGTFCNREHS